MMGRVSLRGTFLGPAATGAVHRVVRWLALDLRLVARRRPATADVDAGAVAETPSPVDRSVGRLMEHLVARPVGAGVLNASGPLRTRDAGRAENSRGGTRLNAARTSGRTWLIDRDRQDRRGDALLDRGHGYIL
jgi:hypothetical protein